MGNATSSAAHDERGSYRPPSMPGSSSDLMLDVVMAAVRIQRVVRGRQARRNPFYSAMSVLARNVHTATKTAVISTQRGALSIMLEKADAALEDTYAKTLKPNITPCPATPVAVRWTAHVLGDHAWASAHASLVDSIGEVLADRFLPPAEAPDEKRQIRQVYAFSGEPWRRAYCAERSRMLLMRARALLLYSYAPYDQTFWMKLGAWDSLGLMILATIPIARVRNSLYTALLLCLTLPLADASAYQYMHFILQFKGSQFFSGLLLGLHQMWHLWQCAVLTEQQTCGDDLSGGDEKTITDQVFFLLYSQGLVALALYLGHRVSTNFSLSALLYKQLERVDAAFTRWVLGVAWLLGALANSETEAEEFGLAWQRDDEDEHGHGVLDPLLEIAFVRDVLASAFWVHVGRTLLAWRQQFGQWVRDRPMVEHAVARATQRRAAADLEAADAADDAALEFDVFSSVFFWLLLWDGTACFLFVTALFGSVEGAGTGWGWRARQSYYVLNSVFMMSALPFVPFWMAAKLGSSAGMGPSTAFNRHGLCVPINTTGLSAYCVWVLRIVNRWDVKRTLPLTDRRTITKEAKRLLEYTETFPHAHRAHAVRKAELRAALDEKLRRALASHGVEDVHTHGVYRKCFPNESAVAMYTRRSAKRVEDARAERVKAFGERFRARAGLGEASAL